MLSAALEFIGVALAVLPLLLIRAVRPLILIRFARLPTYRIGMLAGNPEVYLSERDAGMHRGRALDILFPDNYVANQQLMKMWKRRLHIWNVTKPLHRVNSWLPGGGRHLVPWRNDETGDRDIHGLLAATRVHVGFTTQEENQGREQRRELGIPDDTPFVCFHARDPAYLEALSKVATGRHDSRDSNIHNYLPAAEALASKGYFSVRMGSVVRQSLKATNQMIIDYASRGTTDLLDVYLSANCTFFICSPTGMSRLPMIFRRPCVYANFVPFGGLPAWGASDLSIPKRLWLRDEGRFMTFSEILDTGAGEFEISDLFVQRGIEPLENTPEEISAVVLEMEQRLKGTWQTTDEDEALQQRFWSLFQPGRLNRVFRSRVGAEFLHQNKDLLD